MTAGTAEQVLVSPHVWGLSDFEIANVALISPSIEKNDSEHIALPIEKTFEIYGDADEVISPDNMQAFAERLGIEVSVVEGAGHFFHGRLTELKKLLEQHSFGSDS